MFRALRTFDLVLEVNLLPLQARDTILWVSCSEEAATHSGGRWGKDYTLFATAPGTVEFEGRKINVV